MKYRPRNVEAADASGNGPVCTSASSCPVEQGSQGFTRPLSVLIAALREIFDESAYARFLNCRQVASSRQAYAAFCRESEEGKARRPRCC
jgi:hypothetical protein